MGNYFAYKGKERRWVSYQKACVLTSGELITILLQLLVQYAHVGKWKQKDSLEMFKEYNYLPSKM